MDRLLKKHKAAAKFVPAPIIERKPNARVGIITLGGCDPAVREAVDILAARGIPADYMRIRGFPFDESVEDFIEHHNFCFVVEQNRDAQLRSLAGAGNTRDQRPAALGPDLRRLPAQRAARSRARHESSAAGIAQCHHDQRFEFADHCVRYLGVIHHAVDRQT